jgi:hypothetical protein
LNVCRLRLHHVVSVWLDDGESVTQHTVRRWVGGCNEARMVLPTLLTPVAKGDVSWGVAAVVD